MMKISRIYETLKGNENRDSTTHSPAALITSFRSYYR